MTNDLINVENIERDFCFYELEYQSYTSSHKLKNGKRVKAYWTIHKTFDGWSRALKINYRFAIDKQKELARKHSINIVTMMALIKKLSDNKLIPLSLQPRMLETLKCKGRKADMHVGKLSSTESEGYKRLKLYRYVFRAQIISFLIQKREDIFKFRLPYGTAQRWQGEDYLAFNEDEQVLYDKMIKVFTDMNTATINCISFDQAVENLYKKTMDGLGDEDEKM